MSKGTQSQTKMMAALCHGPGQNLELTAVPIPEPGRGELLVQLEACGICHSDLHLRDGDEKLPAEVYPITLGHEGIGRVVSKGANVDNVVSVGDRVGLPWIYNTCCLCRCCLTGHETLCLDQNIRGIDRSGAFAEYAVCDAKFACPIPEDIDPIVAAPLLCAGLTAWSALSKTKLSSNSSVLIIGAGGLGQYAIQIAKVAGATVFVSDQNQSKLNEANRLGADNCFLSGPATGTDIKALGGADIVLNFAPSSSVWPIVQDAVNPRSEIVLIALVYESVPLSTMWLIDGGHKLIGSSVGTRQEIRDFLDFATRNRIRLNTESVRLDEVNATLDRLAKGQVIGRACVDFRI